MYLFKCMQRLTGLYRCFIDSSHATDAHVYMLYVPINSPLCAQKSSSMIYFIFIQMAAVSFIIFLERFMV